MLERDKEAQAKAPQVLRDDIKKANPQGPRSFSTLARRQQEATISFEDTGIKTQGHQFGLPALPLENRSHIRHRYEPIVKQVTNLLMRDGKLSVAQRVCPSVHLI